MNIKKVLDNINYISEKYDKILRRVFSENYSEYKLELKRETNISKLIEEKTFFSATIKIETHPVTFLAITISVLGLIYNIILSGTDYQEDYSITLFVIIILFVIFLAILGAANTYSNMNRKMKVELIDARIKELTKNKIKKATKY